MTNSSSELWSYSVIASEISRTLSSNKKYRDQAKEKFEYFRMGSPTVWFDIDIKDLSDEIKNQLVYYIKDCDTIQEKYNKLNIIFAEAIASIYKRNAHIILEDKLRDKEPAENAIHEIFPALFNHWTIFWLDPDIDSTSSLNGLNGYAPTKPLHFSPSLLISKEEEDKKE